MSDYSSNEVKCTCDTPHGSESRKCEYCQEKAGEKAPGFAAAMKALRKAKKILKKKKK